MVISGQTYKNMIFIQACSLCIQENSLSEKYAKLSVPSSDQVTEVGLSATSWVIGAVFYGAVHLNTTNFVQFGFLFIFLVEMLLSICGTKPLGGFLLDQN